MKFRSWVRKVKYRRKKRRLKRVSELHADREIWAQKNAIMGSRGEQDYDQAGLGKSRNSITP